MSIAASCASHTACAWSLPKFLTNSVKTVSVTHVRCAVVFEVSPLRQRSLSTRATLWPARFSRYAAVIPVIPAPTTSTSTAMSSFNAENLGAGVLSIQQDPVAMELMTVRNASGRPKQWVRWDASGAVGAQIVREGAHCLSAVADGCFLVVRHFAERPAVIRIPENRVVAEAVRPGRFPREQSFYLCGCFEQHVAVGAQPRARRQIAPSDRAMALSRTR